MCEKPKATAINGLLSKLYVTHCHRCIAQVSVKLLCERLIEVLLEHTVQRVCDRYLIAEMEAARQTKKDGYYIQTSVWKCVGHFANLVRLFGFSVRYSKKTFFYLAMVI
jgi:hypothetical protein